MAKDAKDVLSEVGRFRLTKTEFKRVKKECNKFGITPSEFFRSAVLKKRIRINVDTRFNYDFNKITLDMESILEHVNINNSIDLLTLEILQDIQNKLDRILDAKQNKEI